MNLYPVVYRIYDVDEIQWRGQNLNVYVVQKNLTTIFFLMRNLKNSVTLGLTDFFLSSLIVYESILIRIYMNAKIMKMQILHKIKYDLKGHIGSS